MNIDFNNALLEARKQLSAIVADSNFYYCKPARPGYKRGIDYYTFTDLPIVLANCFMRYNKKFGAYPDIVNPSGLNEKVIWSKFFSEIKIPESGNKLLTSRFIPDELRATLCCPKIVWHSRRAQLPDNHDIAPGSYYLKSSHGSKMFHRIRYPLSPKTKARLEEVCQGWLDSPYGIHDGEWWYNVFPRENLLEQSVSGDADSSAWCFYTFKSINPFISVIKTTKDSTETVWLDDSGKPLETQKNNAVITHFDLPENFLTLQQLALAIGKHHNFVRVDFLLEPDGKIFLGEITFSPGNGLVEWPAEIDKMLGNLWQHA